MKDFINMNGYKYETHMHTKPVSRCAKATVRESLEFYKALNYDGIFVTNHFLDGNINVDASLPYEAKIDFYFSDYYKAVELSSEIGIKVFCGVEISYGDTDFLVYGLDKKWFLAHPEIMTMKKSEELKFFVEHGALVIQAHPFREAGYIDHIRLYPRCVHGVEAVNACRTDFENKMATIYAESYGLLKIAGSDNHIGKEQTKLAGMMFDSPLKSEADFIDRVMNGYGEIFTAELN